MKRGNKLLVLLLVLLLVSGGTWLVLKLTSKDTGNFGETAEEAAYAYTIDEENLKKLSWNYSYAGSSYTFTKNDDGTWTYEADEHFPVSSSMMSQVAGVIEALPTTRALDEIDESYGLDSPYVEITVNDTDKIIFGGTNGTSTGYYITVNGKPYVVDKSYVEPFRYDLSNFIEDDVIPMMRNTIDVVLETADYSYHVIRDTSDSEEDRWELEGSSEETVTDAVYLVITNFENYEFETRVTYYAADEELSSYGFDEPRLRITAICKESNEDPDLETTYIFEIGNDSDYDGYVFARMNQSNKVYLVRKACLEYYLDLTEETFRTVPETEE